MAAITAIYRHHVLHGLASFEEAPPDQAELTRRRDALLADGLPYLVAIRGDAVIGYAYAGPYRSRSAYRYSVEDSIYVAPGQARQGIGRALLGPLIERSSACGKRQMVAVIGDSANRASIGLHAAFGFVMIGTLPAIGWKFGRWVDGVLMQRALGSGSAAAPTG